MPDEAGRASERAGVSYRARRAPVRCDRVLPAYTMRYDGGVGCDARIALQMARAAYRSWCGEGTGQRLGAGRVRSIWAEEPRRRLRRAAATAYCAVEKRIKWTRRRGCWNNNFSQKRVGRASLAASPVALTTLQLLAQRSRVFEGGDGTALDCGLTMRWRDVRDAGGIQSAGSASGISGHLGKIAGAQPAGGG
ncbi:hypothetical protein BV20DRAFT_110556 [Pilatotrama ljubarskyi]|nr:hypothetical protein BV20DRAFT_110556 [Pilatotrama ljubarskyi]